MLPFVLEVSIPGQDQRLADISVAFLSSSRQTQRYYIKCAKSFPSDYFLVTLSFNNTPQNFTSLSTLAELWKANASFVTFIFTCVHAGKTRVTLECFFFFQNLSRKFKFRQNLTRITGTLREDRYKFLIISRSVLLGMRNVSDKIVEKIKTIYAQ